MNKKQYLSDKSGFTLIELVVVIAILAALVALAAPAFTGVLDGSKKQVAQSNAKIAFTAAQSYYYLNDGVYPANAQSGKQGDKITYLGDDDLKTLLGENFTGYAAVCFDGEGAAAAQWRGDDYCAVFDARQNAFYGDADETYAGELGCENGKITINGTYIGDLD